MKNMIEVSFAIKMSDQEIPQTDEIREQALQIKQWRKVDGYTWRAVARAFTEKYLPKEEWTNNQILGMELCYAAMTYLGEEVKDGWN